jgi:EmrB/QacA subfamily drug resistance transporter
VTPRREVLVAFSGMMLATLLAALDQTIVATALPRIVGDLGGFEHLSWVVTAYLIASTVTIPLYGKLSDLYGRRRLMAISIAIFVVGSLLCGIAQSMNQLIAARALQGIGAGGLIPLSQAAIADLVPPRERGRYLGYIGVVWAASALAGPLLGGTLTDHVSWRWIFYINLPLGGFALAVVLRNMRAASARREHDIDWAGAALLSVGVTAVLLALAGSPVWVAGLGVALLGAFVVVEQRAAEPVVPFGLFRNRVLSVATGGSFVIGAMLFGVTVFVPVYVQSVLGASATSSGVILMPMTLAWVVTVFISGQLITRWGRIKPFPVAGSVLIVAGVAALTQVDTGTSRLFVAAALGVCGIGMGASLQPYTIAGQNAASQAEVGVATANLMFARSMGGSLAVAGLGALLADRVISELRASLGAASERVNVDRLLQGSANIPPELLDGTRTAMSDSLALVFAVVLVLALAAVALAFSLQERPLRGSNG